ncbi:hypothetical protein PACTADRAFT_49209 [Pachysolen tannophilus NRRL Y-2460]|uniref:Fe2OG dioxygenase domain-containing protein n=1 Tax=Pachysolen tannophilus NRRL Y-2460 TaxID=669874 RepID=A0A1E4TVE6_PACTA|nr:hypothetical protein PACTADRAFT_49209 [Pachysolen tannophilus NRRL Y-2460]
MTDKFDDDIPAIVGWHKDSYPFVCVLMLSDTETSIGTETLLKKGNGEIIGTPNPSKGKAVVLQGGLINHLAPKPLGFTERITAVTSYRAKNPMTKDCSVLRSVKPEVNFGSNFNTFYPDWVNYRMKLVAEKCELIKNEIEKEANEGKTFRKEDWMQSLKDLENYVATTWKEMVVTNEEYARAL